MMGTSDDADVKRLQTDQPIARRSEDDLSRLSFVDLLVEEIRNAPTDDGFVMGLTGPWGEGKTSVLNLVEDALEDEVAVVRFNPWLFTDAHALVLRFFGELGAQVGRHHRLRSAGKKLAAYGKAVAPLGSLVVGPAADLVTRSLGALAAGETRAADDERQELVAELRARKQRILVLVDDIDRLQDEEIVDVMRLVKLVGDLPFVTYLLAFDRPYVEAALGREQADGRSYLEKVVQVSWDLPKIRRAEIERLLLNRLNSSLSGTSHLPMRDDRWEEVLTRGMMPFFRNLRDVVRYTSSVRASVKLVGKDVALEDVLALETLRVFESKVHQELPRLIPALTKQRSGLFIDQEREEKKEIQLLEDVLTHLSEERKTRVSHLLAVLFPRGGDAFGGPSYRSDQWRVNRQVADASVLRTYIHASIEPDTASYSLVERAVQALGDQQAFLSVLANVEAEVVVDLLSQLPDFSEKIDPSDVKLGVAGLLRLETKIPEDREPFRPVPDFYLKQAIRAVIGVLSNVDQERATLIEVFKDASSPSEKLNLIYWFGTFPDRERKQPEFEILDAEQTQELQEGLNAEVRRKGAPALIDERKMFWLILEAFHGDENYRTQLAQEIDDSTLLALLSKFTGYSIDGDEMVFNLSGAEKLFARDFLSARLEQLTKSDTRESDSSTLLLLQAALDKQPPQGA